MRPQLNHTIVPSNDPEAGARFLAEVMGFDAPERFGPFHVVEAGNGVSLDYIDAGGERVEPRHYAFLVTEQQFDEILARVRARERPIFADPHAHQAGEINHNDGGRGVYFPDPDGHWLEIITRPYGSGPS
jgi:catechol 2,3-dioxygenase-like lactoylglutathione lyase family enzyme